MLNGSERSERSEDEEEKPNKKSCWIERTELEKGMVALLILSVVLISTLVILLLLYTKSNSGDVQDCKNETDSGNELEYIAKGSASSHVPLDVCETQTCLKEALSILNRIDSETSPCEDFYTFACNNMPKLTVKNQYYGPFTDLIQEAKATIQEMHSEPIREDEHNLVKIQKTMYKLCLNESAVINGALDTILEVLKEAGGWPVVEGSNWDGSKFDWLEATYKFRDMGYFYSSFLELDLVEDPLKRERFILQVKIPDVRDVYSRWFDSDDKNVFMADVAMVFGAQPPYDLDEMAAMHQFLEDLQWLKKEMLGRENRIYRLTIADYQSREAAVDWYKFISMIAGPNIKVDRNDYVLFPSERDLDDWFGLLTRTPRLTLANYMMWRVVEEALPFLTEELRKGKVRPRLMVGLNGYMDTRAEFCMNEIGNSFSPNPIEVMYMRQYLPKEKRDKIKKLINNMKVELLEIVTGLEWMTARDKKDTFKRIKEVDVILGARGNYFDDGIFQTMDFHLNYTKQNFLGTIAQVRKISLDRMYSLIDKSPKKVSPQWKNVLIAALDHNPNLNEIYIPASIVQSPIYIENRPNYLNYANMGIALKYFFFRILGVVYQWSNQTEEAFDAKRECLVYKPKNEKITIPNHMVDGLLAHNLALKVSHTAYKKWAENNQEEPLGTANFTTRQLFWLSSGNLYCQYTSPFFIDHLDDKAAEEFIFVVKEVINNNLQLREDFHCSKSQMDLRDDCKIF